MNPGFWINVGIAIFLFLLSTAIGISHYIDYRQDQKHAARLGALPNTDPERAQAGEDRLAQHPIVNGGLGGPLPSQGMIPPASRDDRLATVLTEFRAQDNGINLTAPASNGPAMVISMAVQDTNVGSRGSRVEGDFQS